MNTLETLRQRLATLEPTRLEIVDDSASHAGHAGARSGGGHFLLTIVSPRFTGLGTMARHRLVYTAAGDLMNGPIHALSIAARSPDES